MKINKFTMLETIYTATTILQAVAQYTLPYAVTEETTVRVLFIFPILHVVLSLIFKTKFKGGLEYTPISTLLVYKGVLHGLPLTYYFMFRRIFRPAIPYVLIVLLLEAIQVSTIILDNKLFQVRKGTLNEAD